MEIEKWQKWANFGGLFILQSLRELKGGLTRKRELLIIQGIECYKSTLLHFVCYGKDFLTGSKVY